METTIIEGNKCPKCWAKIDANTCTDGDSTPDPGDFSVCSFCASILRYDSNLKLFLATAEDFAECDEEFVEMLNSLSAQFIGKWRI
jgi:hypothetical protein